MVKVPCGSINDYKDKWNVASFTNYQGITDEGCLKTFSVLSSDVTFGHARSYGLSGGVITSTPDHIAANFSGTAELIAIPKAGNVFVGWNDDNFENPRTVTVTGNEDVTYTAIFAECENEYEPCENCNAELPIISSHPQSATYAQNATPNALSVAASVTDGGTLSYQWYSNTTDSNAGGATVGANSASYTPSTATVGTMYYYVVVTNTNNNATESKTAIATSNTAAVTITADIEPSSDATLQSLTVSAGTLTPVFDESTFSYAVIVEYSVTSITLTATPSYSGASVTGDGEKTSLNVGENRFEIEVTAEDGTTKITYTVVVIRESETSESTWLIGYPNAADVVATLNGGTLTISGTGAMQDWASGSKVPWNNATDGYTDLDHITSVIINNEVTTIGDYAFCTAHNISNLSIPNSVTTIGEMSFYNCLKLTVLNIPDGVKTIKRSAFHSCHYLTSVNIPASVTSIGENAFGIPYGHGIIVTFTDLTVNWATPISILSNIFLNIDIANVNLHVPEGTQCTYTNAPVWKDFKISPACSTDEEDYDFIRESEHFIFEIPYSYLPTQISPANLQRWLSHLDAAYESYAELTGLTPCGGQKIKIVEASGTMYGWAWVYGGHPYIYWNPECISSELKSIDEFDNWSFGILHEIGHLFDKDSEPNWVFHGEVTANLKVVYAIDVLLDCHYNMGGYRYSLQDMYDYFYNWSIQDDGDDDRYTDKITLAFINVARRYGWSVFTQAFKSYSDDSYPYAGSNCGAEKYNEFVDRLEYFSGSADIRNECFNVGNWLETIERHYPLESFTTWQIGYSNPEDVIATFENGTLTISGHGAMQNFDSMPWDCLKDDIIYVVINEGVTTIGNYAFNGCPNLTSVTIGNSVQTIGEFAFSWCHKLSLLTMGNSVQIIGGWAFERCYDLVSFSLPNSVQIIDEAAFFACYNLQSVVIPDFVQRIGRGSFSYCNNLTSLTIGHSVNHIGVDAFDQCDRLENVSVYWETPLQIERTVFGEVVNLEKIYLNVPSGSQCAYAAASVWQDFDIVGLPLSIVASAGNGGSISPDGTTNVNCGNSQTYHFTPDTGYEINEVLVDGIANSAAKENGSYTFSNVTGNHSISVTFNAVSSITGANEIEAAGYSIYPNPANDEIFIQSEFSITKVEIYSSTGALLLSEKNFNEKISISTLSQGVYVVKIYTEKGLIVSKVVKE